MAIDKIANTIGVSPRTVRDWKRGKYTIPQCHFETILKIQQHYATDYVIEKLADHWHTAAAGQLGGQAYIQRYKIIGDQTSRKKGGLRSFELRKDKDDIFTPKSLQLPTPCPEMAEFFGIMIGDGHINQYYISITLDIKTDFTYAAYVTNLICQLFGLEPSIQERPERGCIVIIVSSVKLVTFLSDHGLVVGNKIRQELGIPSWIIENADYTVACLRGIFDTDGSVFQEIHRHKDVFYKYPRLSLTSASPMLLAAVQQALHDHDIRAKIKSQKNVTIDNFTDIKKYFIIVGSSNPKHLERWATFGGVG